MTKRKHTIYGLFCPIDKEYKYIGQTVLELKTRLSGHIKGFPCNKRKVEWIKMLSEKGLEPTIVPIEETTFNKVLSRENYWIRFYRKQGNEIFNGPLNRKKKPSEFSYMTFGERYPGISK